MTFVKTMTVPDKNEHVNFDTVGESVSKLVKVVYRIIQHKVLL